VTTNVITGTFDLGWTQGNAAGGCPILDVKVFVENQNDPCPDFSNAQFLQSGTTGGTNPLTTGQCLTGNVTGLTISFPAADGTWKFHLLITIPHPNFVNNTVQECATANC
jgi:hypothetical protein